MSSSEIKEFHDLLFSAEENARSTHTAITTAINRYKRGMELEVRVRDLEHQLAAERKVTAHWKDKYTAIESRIRGIFDPATPAPATPTPTPPTTPAPAVAPATPTVTFTGGATPTVTFAASEPPIASSGSDTEEDMFSMTPSKRIRLRGSDKEPPKRLPACFREDFKCRDCNVTYKAGELCSLYAQHRQKYHPKPAA
jgi:hypothetical protein